MKKIYNAHILLSCFFAFLFSLVATPIMSARIPIPDAALPLGSPDLTEVRTIKELRPGLTHIDIKRIKANVDERPMSIQIIILNPKVYRGKVISSWAEAGWLVSPYELAHRDNAVVAANASFYEFSQDEVPGVPSGLSIVQGIWHHEPDRYDGFPFLAIENTKEGPRLSIETEVPPRPHLKSGGRSIYIDGFDRAPKPGKSEIVVMRHHLVDKSQYSHGTAERLYTTARVNEKSSGLSYYIIASGEKEKELQALIDSEAPLELDLSVPGRPGLNVFFASTPPLILNGKTKALDNTARHTRTTVGADAEGNIYLIVVGPDRTMASLVTLHDLQVLGKFLGLVNYYNLDGGLGSVSLVVDKETIDSPEVPFYRERRRVSDCILIVDHQ